jgi:hypothetical protein
MAPEAVLSMPGTYRSAYGTVVTLTAPAIVTPRFSSKLEAPWLLLQILYPEEREPKQEHPLALHRRNLLGQQHDCSILAGTAIIWNGRNCIKVLSNLL